jgi:hypothetical protein
MYNSWPMVNILGLTPGLTIKRSSRLTPYRNAIPDNVSPLCTVWTKGVAVGPKGGGDGKTGGVVMVVGVEVALWNTRKVCVGCKGCSTTGSPQEARRREKQTTTSQSLIVATASRLYQPECRCAIKYAVLDFKRRLRINCDYPTKNHAH